MIKVVDIEYTTSQKSTIIADRHANDLAMWNGEIIEQKIWQNHHIQQRWYKNGLEEN